LPQRIYPVVDRAHWVDRLGAAGARFIQIRIKDRTGEALLDELREAMRLARRHRVSLVVNDFWREAIEIGAPWLHLGQEDLDTADLDTIRAAGIRLGVSTHCIEELDRALAIRPDYVALGPIWETRLKKMAFGPQGTARLTEWRHLIEGLPLVAIGGITLARAPECLKAGADCVSAVSDFILSEDPEAQVAAWLRATG
jgi:thiamine-phosphate pyrophosphorylase